MSDDQFDKLYKAIERQSKIMGRRLEATDKEYSDQFDKLFKYMEKRFSDVDRRFEAMDKKYNNQFDKLFKYMEQRFAAVDRRFEAMDKKFDGLIGAIDDFAKRMEIYDHERLALGNQVDRHERWHHQTAKAIGLDLQT